MTYSIILSAVLFSYAIEGGLTAWVPPVPKEFPPNLDLKVLCNEHEGETVNVKNIFAQNHPIIVGFFYGDCPISRAIVGKVQEIIRSNPELSEFKFVGINSMLKAGVHKKLCASGLTLVQDSIITNYGDDGWVTFGSEKDDLVIYGQNGKFIRHFLHIETQNMQPKVEQQLQAAMLEAARTAEAYSDDPVPVYE